jgi:Bacterial extracellular solute-binding proteins, family 5 Middle
MRRITPPIPLLATAQALLISACAAPGRGPATPPPAASPCVVAPAVPRSVAGARRGSASGDIEVMLAGPVDPTHAPAAVDASERLVFRQVYQTLVEIGCDGRARPGLAASWSHDREGRGWRFTLRPDARFWDGTPVDAHAVARSFASHTPPPVGAVTVPRIASASALGQRELTVLLSEPSTSAETFAGPALAVTGPGSWGPWPLGTGPYHPAIDVEVPAGGVRVEATGATAGGATITFSVLGAADARGALDAGADVLVTADPSVIAYARALPDFTVAPLPWSRTYVVAATGSRDGGEATSVSPPAEALDGLARGAVRADARPAEAPFWWRAGACTGGAVAQGADGGWRRAPPGGPATRRPVARIVYPVGDAVGRGIAERLVALAGAGSSVPAWLADALPALGPLSGAPVAAGLDPASLARTAQSAAAVAFVVPVPRAPGGPCLSALLGGADVMTAAVLSPAAGLRVTPLVDVRSSLVVRAGVGGITFDGDGTLVFQPGGAAP